MADGKSELLPPARGRRVAFRTRPLGGPVTRGEPSRDAARWASAYDEYESNIDASQHFPSRVGTGAPFRRLTRRTSARVEPLLRVWRGLRRAGFRGKGAAHGTGAGAGVALGAGAGATEGAASGAGAGAGATGAVVTAVALAGAVLLAVAIAPSEQLHSSVQPFHVELVSLTTLQVTTPQFVPLMQGLAGLPAAPRSHACACPS
jgi:hypothetical protein